MKIDSGRKKTALKGVIYGPEGVGKTTLASHFPDPLFIDLEHGTNQLDVKRLADSVTNWGLLNEAVNEIAKDPTICKTLIIDTADMAELLCSYYVLHKHNITSIAQPDYGKGYVYLADEFQKFLNKLTKLNRDQQINIVFIAHSQLKKFEQPDEYGAYDRYELKLEKKVAQALKEWGDFVFFLNYKVEVIKADGKMGKSYKATGGSRKIYTTHSPVWDAKNRFGLAEELPLEYKSIEKMFEFDNRPSVHITDKNDPVFDDEPMIVKDEDVEDLKDIVGDPTVAKIISRLTENNFRERDAVAMIKSKKIKPVSGNGDKLKDYDKAFLEKNILNQWDGFLKVLKKGA